MTIKVYKDRIEIGAYTLTATPTGASFNGSIAASKLSTEFVVGQGKSFGYNIAKTSSGGGGYRFSFVSDSIIQSIPNPSIPNNHYRGTSHSSETHGYLTQGNGFYTTPFFLPVAGPSTWQNGLGSPYGPGAVGVPIVDQEDVITSPTYLGPIIGVSRSPPIGGLNFTMSNPSSTPNPGIGGYSPAAVVITDSRVVPTVRFSFNSSFATEDVGLLASVLKSPTYPLSSNIGLSSRQDGYAFNNFGSILSNAIVRKFSFSSAVNKALFYNSTPVYCTFAGSSVSTEQIGYFVDNGTITPGTTSYKKFPFVNENTIVIGTSIGPSPTLNGLDNSGFMAGISGPTAGYFSFGAIRYSSAFCTIYRTNFPIYNSNYYAGIRGGDFQTPAVSPLFNRSIKFEYANDVTSVIPHNINVGGGGAGTANPTHGYILNSRNTAFRSHINIWVEQPQSFTTGPFPSPTSPPFGNPGSPRTIPGWQYIGGITGVDAFQTSSNRAKFSFSSEATINSIDNATSVLNLGSALQY